MTKTAILSYSGGEVERIENVIEAETDWGAKTTVRLTHPDGSMTTRTGYGVRLAGFENDSS
jgi:hypothetical protein